MTSQSHRLVAVFILLLSQLAAMPARASDSLLLGVHPYLDAETIIQRFTPLAEYLSQRLQTPIEVRVGRDYESHKQAIASGTVDIAFLGPSTYIRLVEEFGQVPLLARLEANGMPSFRGHIIVRTDSNLQQLGELQGKYFAFGDQNSTMSTLVPQAMLAQQGVTLANLSGYRHYNGHKNVALAVLSGDADAGAVKEEVFQHFSVHGLRSLAPSPAISEHLFITRQDLEAKRINELRKALLDIKPAGKTDVLLKPIKSNLTGLVAVDDRDYDSLRDLMLDQPAATP